MKVSEVDERENRYELNQHPVTTKSRWRNCWSRRCKWWREEERVYDEREERRKLLRRLRRKRPRRRNPPQEEE